MSTATRLPRSSGSTKAKIASLAPVGHTSQPALLQRAQTAPETLSTANILSLQRTIGNRATIGLLSRSTGLQAKLKLGPAGDKYEQEADHVADQVVRHMDHSQPTDTDVQRHVDEEEMAQMKPLHGAEGGEVESSVAQQIQSARGGGQPLNDGIRAKMEQGFGADFSGVRVHTGGQADTLNRSLNARAFTVGNDVFFGKGQYNPGSSSGQQLLAHELTHTVQQGAAGVQRQTVQRLMSSTQLTQKAGAPKKDKKIFGFKKKMSGKYKDVLNAIDAYNNIAPGVVSPQQNIRIGVAENLKTHLQAVKDAVQIYIDEHGLDDNRSKAVADVYRDAEMERRAIDVIVKKPAFHGMAWRLAIAPFMRVHELTVSGAFDSSLFHGTGSSLLNYFQGELMTGQELERRGIKRGTGEGDFFSRARADQEKSGEKDFISVGLSLPGMGTSLTYAKAAGSDKNYNTAVYTDEELQTELQQLNDIIDNWNENLNQVPHDDIMAARKNLGQFKGLQRRLQTEFELRQNLALNHPRRRGQKYHDSTYGILLEFGDEDLEVVNPRNNLLHEEKQVPKALGGERSVKTPVVDLRIRGRLRRVYCPLENMQTVRQRLSEIIGHNEFEVIPFEVLDKDFMDSSMEHTEQLTVDVLEQQYEKMRRNVLGAYAEGMKKGEPIDGKMLTKIAKSLNL